MSGTVAELRQSLSGCINDRAKEIAFLWDKWNQQRFSKINQWSELRNYVFATDTSTTTNAKLPWKNSTTTPKICQIRDNLHANYISALFPNSNWMKWEGGTFEDDTKQKADAITAYIYTKTQECGFRDIMSKLVYDYIDYGNVFAEVDYVRNVHLDENGLPITIYEGPIPRRISPLDIVFNPIAPSFDESPKIIRKILQKGELIKLAQGDKDWMAAYQKHEHILSKSGSYSVEDFQKAMGISIDGFGNLQEYYQSQYVEVLEFRGDYLDPVTNEIKDNYSITVIDRVILVCDKPIDNWLGKSSLVHVGWRYRPDNLWAMGPLDNLVGLQYRIDHLENLKADAMDLAVHPPVVVYGDVDPFDWGPGVQIPIVSDGKIEELGKNLNSIITADQQIATYEQKMEEYAGAPKQAMGIRTPGEKTAFEVQQLENAAGRIFQEKVTQFEAMMVEPVLNLMLECARRNISAIDIARSFDDDFGVDMFLEITKEDITARGKLRPIGARHFGERAQLLQNINQLFNGPLGKMIAPHVSPKALAYLVEDALNIHKYEVVRPNAGMVEQAEQKQMAGNLDQQVQEEQSVPI